MLPLDHTLPIPYEYCGPVHFQNSTLFRQNELTIVKYKEPDGLLRTIYSNKLSYNENNLLRKKDKSF